MNLSITPEEMDQMNDSWKGFYDQSPSEAQNVCSECHKGLIVPTYRYAGDESGYYGVCDNPDCQATID